MEAHIEKGYAMCIIMYDISDGFIRRAINSRLIQKGFKRLQMSVYAGCITTRDMQKLKEDLHATVVAFGEKSDSVIVMPVTNDILEEISFYGRQSDLKEITQKKRVRFF